MPAAVLYTRVSSKDQGEGFSLGAQRDLLEAYARDNGLKVTGRFEESETAKSGGTRPAFGKMVEFLRPRTASTVLLVEKTDRLYRNLKDWITLDELKVEIRFVKEGTLRRADMSTTGAPAQKAASASIPRDSWRARRCASSPHSRSARLSPNGS